MTAEDQILKALEDDRAIKFKKLGKKFYTGGICPGCGETELFISVDKPYQLKCSRNNNCGYAESTRARYSYLWENLGEKHPATETDPNATANAYMSIVRGFPLVKVGQWFEQGTIKLPNGRAAETVRFMLWDGFWWDRLINAKDVLDNNKNGKPNKADFKFGTSYRDKCWQPPGQVINEKDTVYIVEGIFHAIAFSLAGYKVVAAFSCSNLPRDLINQHKGKNITWALAYDAGKGGETADLKFLKEINKLNESAHIVLPHSANDDWDDLWLAEKLNDKYLEECRWRGRLLSAKSAEAKAFALFCWRPFEHTAITFMHGTYSVSVDRSELSKQLQAHNDTDVISFSKDAEIFSRFVTIRPIADCEFQSLYAEKDKFTGETSYVFNVIDKENRNENIVAFSAANMQDKKVFSLALFSKLTWIEFTGSNDDFVYLKKQWKHRNEVETIPFIGYDETSKAYVFNDVGYQDGKCYKKNKHGFIQFKKHAAKTTLANVNFVHSEKFDKKILQDFIKIFDLNGVAALGMWTATLFTRQIKEKHQSFPFLEITGEKEAGKSTLIRFLWKLFGRSNYEGVDMLTTSASSEGRMLSQLSNLPLVMVESDRESDLTKGGRPTRTVDWDSYKKIYDLDGVLMSRGVKTNDNQVSESVFRGALVITQNASVQGSEAIMSRINHLHCTTAHKRIENREIADRLKTMDVKDLAGYLHLVLTHEQEYLAAFFTAFNKHRTTLTKTTNIKSQRIIDNHAQHMASVEALQVLFDNFSKSALEQTLAHIVERAIDRESRLNADHPLVQKFWQTYHHINDQKITLIDADHNETERPNEKLNHSTNKAFIAVNLNDFYEQCRLRNQETISTEHLIKILPTSRFYKFIGQKTVRSQITKGSKRCFVFERPIAIENTKSN